MLVFRIVSVFAPNHVDQGLEELVPCTHLVFLGRVFPSSNFIYDPHVASMKSIAASLLENA